MTRRISRWIKCWTIGARPRTLPAAVVPVVMGTAVAVHCHHAVWWRAGCALVVALALQIAANYANDYSDGIRGTDAQRVGPVRLVASGLASPGDVKRAALLAFAVATVAGVGLSLSVNPWLILIIGLPSGAAAWYYTGGKNPYGYKGFGELSVFVFFGPVAVMGTAYVQVEQIRLVSLVTAVPVGLLAVALLVVNNLRDRQNDALVAKRTLAVRLGDRRTRWLFVVCVLTPFVISGILGLWIPLVWVSLAALGLGLPLARNVLSGESGEGLIAVLGRTGKLQLTYGALLAVGVALG